MGSVKEKLKLCAIELLTQELMIPEYQRPYEWTKENIYILMEDILSAYNEDRKKILNLGSVILFKKNGESEIVDGQQRIITLSLLLNILDKSINIPILNKEIMWTNSSENNIYNNNKLLDEIVQKLESKNKINRKEFSEYIKNSITFYLIKPKNLKEAFQLFDGRNSKYKDLTPVDLLKAYHLGELERERTYPKKKLQQLLETWDYNMNHHFSINDKVYINNYIFNDVLFIIYNWSLNKSIKSFEKKDIYLYKGYVSKNNYTYVKYFKSKNKNLYQINKPFKAGVSFFKMTEHYINLFKKLITNYNLREFGIDDNNYYFQYINYLYYNALLLFRDRFGDKIDDFDKETLENYIFKWSMTHRVRNKQVSIDSVNNYVLTENNNFFFECNKALKINELFKLDVLDKGKKGKINDENTDSLQNIRSRLWDKI